MVLRRKAVAASKGKLGVIARAGMVALLAGWVLPAQAADPIFVELDNAKLLKLPQGTETIVIGNPAVADVTIQRNSIMVVTAKTYGSTNMIALDSKGGIISESQIVVKAASKDKLIVMHGTARQTLSCNPECGGTMELGDDDKAFKMAIDQSNTRMQNARGGNLDR